MRDFAQRAAPDLPVRVEVLPGANISAGRNRAIELAQGDIIVVTDGGVVLHAAWLARLVAALEEARTADAPADVAAGFFVPAPQSSFELAMGATVLPAVEDVAPATFLPSSRSVAFRRAAWERAGRYPEWLDYCEDVVFDLALRREGVRQRFVPDARVAFRPRPSLPAFFRQYYRYARGDGKADLWRRRHAIRYGVYLGAPLGWLLGCPLAGAPLAHRHSDAGVYPPPLSAALGAGRAVVRRNPWPLSAGSGVGTADPPDGRCGEDDRVSCRCPVAIDGPSSATQ